MLVFVLVSITLNLYPSSFEIIMMRKKELVALLSQVLLLFVFCGSSSPFGGLV